MGKVIRFTVPGPPCPKPAMKASDRWRKRPCVLRYWAWCDLCRMCAKAAGCPEDAGEVARFSIVCYFAPPEGKKYESRIGQPHLHRPDASNLLKAGEDALFKNDEKLSSVASEKFWGKVSRTEITVELL
jgi:Holliday junction resolvase RusA-like endonuclease